MDNLLWISEPVRLLAWPTLKQTASSLDDLHTVSIAVAALIISYVVIANQLAVISEDIFNTLRRNVYSIDWRVQDWAFLCPRTSPPEIVKFKSQIPTIRGHAARQLAHAWIHCTYFGLLSPDSSRELCILKYTTNESSFTRMNEWIHGLI